MRHLLRHRFGTSAERSAGGRVACAFVLWCGLSCTPQPRPIGEPAPAPEECALLAGPAEEGGAVVVALTDDVDPAAAPVPRNASERLLFGNLYETLIRRDCTGRVLPGLAARWEARDDGRVWLFTLRAGARFWDGTRVTAADVVSCWRARERRTAPVLLPWIAGASALDDSLVAVTHTEPRTLDPSVFAMPAFAVTKPPDVSGWPLGTGPHRPGGPAVSLGARGSSRARDAYHPQDLSPVIAAYPVGARSWTLLHFRLAAGADPRDLLDDGVDLLIADGAARAYAVTLPGFVSVPLPWDNVYVVVSPSPEALAGFAAALPPEAREALARDVVRTDAHGAQRWYGWDEWEAPNAPEACGRVLGHAPAPPSEPARRLAPDRIAYPRADVQARALAERLVAIAGDGRGAGAGATRRDRDATGSAAPPARLDPEPGASLLAVGLDPEPFESAMRKGSEFAYVLPVPIGAACELLLRAPWLAAPVPAPWLAPQPPVDDDPEVVAFARPLRARILPLVETRPWLIARRGLAGVGIDGDGTPRLGGCGWKRTGSAP